MARPAGHELSAEAWDDILRLTGTSLTQIADRADIARPTLSSMLHGHHKASVPVAHKLAGALGVHPRTLFPSLRVKVEEVA